MAKYEPICAGIVAPGGPIGDGGSKVAHPGGFGDVVLMGFPILDSGAGWGETIPYATVFRGWGGGPGIARTGWIFAFYYYSPLLGHFCDHCEAIVSVFGPLFGGFYGLLALLQSCVGTFNVIVRTIMQTCVFAAETSQTVRRFNA